ncbi:MAG: S-layer homology domain-containing protein [Candidatus Cryosericum sp.]
MKRVVSLVLAVVLMVAVLAPVAVANAAGFKDVPASLWASDEINALAARKFIGGYADGTFIIDLHGISFSNYDTFGSVLAFRSDQIPTEKNGMNGQNNYRYDSVDMDKWLNAAQNATTATALRKAYSHIQDIFAEDLPCLYLEQRVYPDEVRKGLKGLKGYEHFFSSTVYNNWNIQYWY